MCGHELWFHITLTLTLTLTLTPTLALGYTHVAKQYVVWLDLTQQRRRVTEAGPDHVHEPPLTIIALPAVWMASSNGLLILNGEWDHIVHRDARVRVKVRVRVRVKGWGWGQVQCQAQDQD
jgi:hypothetical protein